MAEITIAFDPSSSLSKAFYTTGGYSPEWLMMEPDVVEVSPEAIAQYEENRIGSPKSTDSAYISVNDKTYAVGFLAKTRFYAQSKLEVLKFEAAVYKVLALVGVIAQEKKLGTQFSLNLGMLLPYSEYPDRTRFQEILKKALADFKFRKFAYRVRLEAFACLPEGAGLLLKGLDFTVPPSERDVAVIMIGYRNASLLVTHRGQMGLGETTPLGMIRMLEMIVEATSGLSATELVSPIYKAGKRVKLSSLKALDKTTIHQWGNDELKDLQQIVMAARKQYWQLLRDWLKSRKLTNVDTVILAGGTAHYYQEELDKFFKEIPVNWGKKLEVQLQNKMGDILSKKELNWRLTDVYGYFYWCHKLIRNKEKRVA